MLLGYFDLFFNLIEYFDLFLNFLGHFALLMNLLGYFAVLLNFLGYFKVFLNKGTWSHCMFDHDAVDRSTVEVLGDLVTMSHIFFFAPEPLEKELKSMSLASFILANYI